MLAQRQREEALVLLYHRVSPEHDPVFPPLPPEVFADHCRFIKNHFSVISLTELVERHRQGRSLKRCCAITFDDGYRDVLDHAYPILKQYALPATIFLVADCIQ